MKIKRDTTNELFSAVIALIKENGHYEKAAAIMDYYLPNSTEGSANYENFELSNYEFDLTAEVSFGGSEGIYIDCYLEGSYTETPRTRYDHNLGKIVPETHYHIATFKTLKRDLIAMQIMGELCGSLTYYTREYVNQNIKRYSPSRELKESEVTDGE